MLSYFGLEIDQQTIKSVKTGAYTYILTNTEFKFDATLIGYEINVATTGTINLYILKIDETLCGETISCSEYLKIQPP